MQSDLKVHNISFHEKKNGNLSISESFNGYYDICPKVVNQHVRTSQNFLLANTVLYDHSTIWGILGALPGL